MAGIENTVGNKTEKVFHQPAAKRRDVTDDEKRAYSRPENPFGFLRLRCRLFFSFGLTPPFYPRRRFLQRRSRVYNGKFRLPFSALVPEGFDNKSGIFCFGKSFFFHLSLQFFFILRTFAPPLTYTLYGKSVKKSFVFCCNFFNSTDFSPEKFNSLYLHLFHYITLVPKTQRKNGEYFVITKSTPYSCLIFQKRPLFPAFPALEKTVLCALRGRRNFPAKAFLSSLFLKTEKRARI